MQQKKTPEHRIFNVEETYLSIFEYCPMFYLREKKKLAEL